jgi:DNA (cytosine-5)-methyltransferase 1
MPTFGSLFAGIGGIDLGLERAGWTGRWQVEWDPYCQHVLAHHWPDVPRYGDITRVDWSAVEPVDLIAGGFPCQPVSIAGKMGAQDDSRWLWPEFARCIRELRPRYVLVENVRNLLAVNGGRAFGEVLGDLAALGYDAEWDCIPASAVGAPHQRDRVWIVAHRSEQPWPLADADHWRPLDAVPAGRDAGPDVADTDTPRRRDAQEGDTGRGLDGAGPGAHPAAGRGGAPVAGLFAPDTECDQCGEPWCDIHGEHYADCACVGWSQIEDADAERQRLEGVIEGRTEARSADGPGYGGDPGWWSVEPDVGRVAHGVPARVDRLRALGNAVVPQVVEVIGRRLMEAYA